MIPIRILTTTAEQPLNIENIFGSLARFPKKISNKEK